MRIAEICIKQPVLAIVLNLVLVIVGFIGYQHLDIRYFPKLEMPIMSVRVYYKGASPSLMENDVTIPLENAIAGVSGIDTVSSSSWTSNSSVTIRFRQETNFEEGVNEVRDKISAARDKIPVDAEPPTITVGGIEGPALSVGFTDPNMDSAAIRDYVDQYVVRHLQQIAGVGRVSVYGASPYAMRIWLNPQKMAALGVTATDIKTAILGNNIEFPAGSMQDPQRNFSVISDTRLQTPAAFANMVISSSQNHIIRLKDVADVKLGNRSLQDSPMRINGKPAVDVEIKPLKSANPIDVATRVKKALGSINSNLPPGMTAAVNYDQSLFLKASIHETFTAIFEAVLLVVLVVYLFLGSLRAALIPIITIPLCIIAMFGVMLLFSFSINVMTLLAVVLAIGLVVDDAIVMLENIHRYIEKGMAPLPAAIRGSQQIGFAIVAMTITLAVVYAPIGFAEGPTATIFKEFAFTLAGAVVVSGWVAITLSPMMCSKILKAQPPAIANANTSQTTKPSARGLSGRIDNLFEHLNARYRQLLEILLNRRIAIVLILVLLAFVGYLIFRSLPSEFVPKEDTGLIQTSVRAPAGSSIQYTDKYMRQIENIYSKIPGVSDYYSMVNAGTATSYLTLKPWGERKLTTQQIIRELTPKLAAIPGVVAFPYIPDPIDYGAGTNTDITLQLMTADNYKLLAKPLDKLVALAKHYPGFTNVRSTLRFDNQQYQLTINRDLAADLHVNVQDIADTISVMLGGAHISDVETSGRSYEVIVQIEKPDLLNFKGLKKLYVRNTDVPPKMIPLASLVTLTPNIGQSSLTHFNRMRSGALTAQLAPGYTISQGVTELQNYYLKYKTLK